MHVLVYYNRWWEHKSIIILQYLNNINTWLKMALMLFHKLNSTRSVISTSDCHFAWIASSGIVTHRGIDHPLFDFQWLPCVDVSHNLRLPFSSVNNPDLDLLNKDFLVKGVAYWPAYTPCVVWWRHILRHLKISNRGSDGVGLFICLSKPLYSSTSEFRESILLLKSSTSIPSTDV